jgi:hypothetical protein
VIEKNNGNKAMLKIKQIIKFFKTIASVSKNSLVIEVMDKYKVRLIINFIQVSLKSLEIRWLNFLL